MTDANSAEQSQDEYFEMDHYLMDAFPDEMDHMNSNDQDDEGHESATKPARQAPQTNTSTFTTPQASTGLNANTKVAASNQQAIDDETAKKREQKRLARNSRRQRAKDENDVVFIEKRRTLHGEQHQVFKAAAKELGVTQDELKALPRAERLAAFKHVRDLNLAEPYDPTKAPKNGLGRAKIRNVSLAPVKKDPHEDFQASASPQSARNGSSMSPSSLQESLPPSRGSGSSSTPHPVATTTAATSIPRNGAKPGERKLNPKETTPATSSPSASYSLPPRPSPSPPPLSKTSATPIQPKTKPKQPTTSPSSPAPPLSQPKPKTPITLIPKKLTTSSLRSSNKLTHPKKSLTVYGPQKNSKAVTDTVTNLSGSVMENDKKRRKEAKKREKERRKEMGRMVAAQEDKRRSAK